MMDLNFDIPTDELARQAYEHWKYCREIEKDARLLPQEKHKQAIRKAQRLIRDMEGGYLPICN